MMKKRQLGVFLFIAIGSITIGSGILYAQAVSLDQAIQAGAKEIDDKLVKGNKVVVLNFKSTSQRMSDFILDEMMTALVKSGKITVVDRANLELIQQEMSFQMSGEVSDSSAQAIGQKLGAQSIISGSIDDMGTTYRIRFRTIEVVSAAIQVLSSFDVKKEGNIIALMGSDNTGTASGGGSTKYPNGLNFSQERKIGVGFLNWIYGVGSFTMGDIVGGLIVGGLEIAGNFVFFTGVGDGYEEPDETLMMIGMGVALVGTIYGHIRPFSYDKALAKKNGTYYSMEEGNPLYHISFMPTPARNGIGVGVFYSMSY
jgi:TolB-like protein